MLQIDLIRVKGKFGPMTGLCRLSVNVNKIATLRNSRGGSLPNVSQCTHDILVFGAEGITVHPRPDERHIRKSDVFEISKILKKWNKSQKSQNKVEFNIEGYPSTSFLDLITKIKPDQVTFVPDKPNVITSNAGWKFKKNEKLLTKLCRDLRKSNIRTSLFLDVFAMNPSEYQALNRIMPSCIEFYTEKYALDFDSANKKSTLRRYAEAATKIDQMGIAINAGHDLNSNNLRTLLQNIPAIREVSIGHAIICESLYLGLQSTIQLYKNQIRLAGPRSPLSRVNL